MNKIKTHTTSFNSFSNMKNSWDSYKHVSYDKNFDVHTTVINKNRYVRKDLLNQALTSLYISQAVEKS